MRILGIDPGIAIVGFGVVDSDRGKHSFVRCGVITTPAGTMWVSTSISTMIEIRIT